MDPDAAAAMSSQLCWRVHIQETKVVTYPMSSVGGKKVLVKEEEKGRHNGAARSVQWMCEGRRMRPSGGGRREKHVQRDNESARSPYFSRVRAQGLDERAKSSERTRTRFSFLCRPHSCCRMRCVQQDERRERFAAFPLLWKQGRTLSIIVRTRAPTVCVSHTQHTTTTRTTNEQATRIPSSRTGAH